MPGFVAIVHVTFDPNVRAGDIVVTAALGGLVWFVKKAYTLIAGFVHRVNENEDTLLATTRMVDRHSRALLKAAIIGPPVEALHHARRSGDVILLDPRENEIRT